MDKVRLYLKYRKNSYLLYSAFFIGGFIIIISIFGPPKYYVVPILSIMLAHGFVEYTEFKRWKKDKW